MMTQKDFSKSDWSYLFKKKKELVGFLRKNVDIFAWDAYNAPGVDHSFICHYLNVNPTSILKK